MSRRDKKRSHKPAPVAMPLLSERQKASIATSALARILSLGFLRLPEAVAVEEAKRYVASTLDMNDKPTFGSPPSDPADVERWTQDAEEQLDMAAEWLYGIARRHNTSLLLLPHHVDMAMYDTKERMRAALYTHGTRPARARSVKIVDDYFAWCHRRRIAILSIVYSVGDRDDVGSVRSVAMACVALNDGVANKGVINWEMNERLMVNKAKDLLGMEKQRLRCSLYAVLGVNGQTIQEPPGVVVDRVDTLATWKWRA